MFIMRGNTPAGDQPPRTRRRCRHSAPVSVVVGRSVTDHGRVMSGAGLVDHRVETVVVVRGVGHFARGAVGFDQTVFSLDHVAVPFFPLVLDVTGVIVLHAVVERILGRRLQQTNLVSRT